MATDRYNDEQWKGAVVSARAEKKMNAPFSNTCMADGVGCIQLLCAAMIFVLRE